MTAASTVLVLLTKCAHAFLVVVLFLLCAFPAGWLTGGKGSYSALQVATGALCPCGVSCLLPCNSTPTVFGALVQSGALPAANNMFSLYIANDTAWNVEHWPFQLVVSIFAAGGLKSKQCVYYTLDDQVYSCTLYTECTHSASGPKALRHQPFHAALPIPARLLRQ